MSAQMLHNTHARRSANRYLVEGALAVLRPRSRRSRCRQRKPGSRMRRRQGLLSASGPYDLSLAGLALERLAYLAHDCTSGFIRIKAESFYLDVILVTVVSGWQVSRLGKALRRPYSSESIFPSDLLMNFHGSCGNNCRWRQQLAYINSRRVFAHV